MRRQSDGAPFGAWLFRCNPRRRDFGRFVEQPTQSSDWCVAPTYRSRLMEGGQRVFLWVSGDDRRTPTPGVWGFGRLSGPAATDGEEPSAPVGSMLGVRLTFRLLAQPLPRTALRLMPALEGLEVLRIPAGSNPAWVTPSERDALLDLIGRGPR